MSRLERSSELACVSQSTPPPSLSPQKVLSSGLTTLAELFFPTIFPRLRGVVAANSRTPRAPIHTLPEELLIAVFKLAAGLYPHHQDYEDSIAGRSRFHTFSLVQLTHVCKRWRDVALGYPCFWFYINHKVHDRAQVFLERSGAVPLWLSVPSDAEDAKAALVSGGDRIMRLDLDVSRSDSNELALLLHVPPMSLKSLTVTYGDHLDPPERHSDQVILFHQEQLPLKALAIKGGHRWLPTNYFPHLTHLQLDLAPEGELPASELYSLLARTPQLEYLFLLCIMPHQELASKTWPSISLPQMRVLSLRCGHFESSAKFIANLVVPAAASIQLDSVVISDNRCPDLIHLAPMSTLHMLEIAIGGGYIHLVAHGKEGAFWLQGFFETDSTSHIRWLGSLHAMLPMFQIEILKLYIGDCPSHFFPILRQMSGVNILQVLFDRQHEQQHLDPASSNARFLYILLAIPSICPNLAILVADVAGEGHEAFPNFHIGAITRALAARGPNKLTVRIQPLADLSRVERSPLDDVLTRIAVHARVSVNNIIIHRPGPPIAPFREGAWWHPAEAFKYWDLGDFEPFYRLPWDMDHALILGQPVQ